MIDITKKHVTERDGFEVELYRIDGVGCYRILGAIKTNEGWEQFRWYYNGEAQHEMHKDAPRQRTELNLIEVKPRIKRTVYLNVFVNACADAIHWSERTASDAAKKHLSKRLACIKVEIDCEEGEGLS